MLVLKRYDPYILLFLTPTYPTTLRIQQIFSSQKKSARLTIFSHGIHIPDPYLNKDRSLKFVDEICLENFLFVGKSLNHQFLIHNLIFHQINKTMKPQVLHRVTS